MPKPKVKGKRIRFAGFVLTNAARDRVVAKWLNEQPNASEAVKSLIYQVAIGNSPVPQGRQPQAAPPPQEREREKPQPSAFVGEVEDIPDVNMDDPDAAALFGAFDT